MICDRLRTLLASARGATVPIVSPTPSPSPTPTPTPTPTAYQARAGFTQPYFGIYDVQPSDLATVGPSGYGFDTAVLTTLTMSNASSESAMVDAVFAANMNLICYPGSQLARLASDSRVPCLMPSIDEPDINGVEADSLATMITDIAALHAASSKPVMLGLSGFYTVLGYTRNRDLLKLQADITAADLYPNPGYLGGGESLQPLWGKTQTEAHNDACAGILTTANGAILKQLRRFRLNGTGAVVDQGVTGRDYAAWFALGDYDGTGDTIAISAMELRRQQFDALIGGARSFFYFPVGFNPFAWLRVNTDLLAEEQRFKTFVSYLHGTLGLLCKPTGGAYPYTVRYSVGGTTSGWNPNDATPTFPSPSTDDAGNPHLQAWFSGCAIVKGGVTYYLVANLDTVNSHTLTDATWGISGLVVPAGDLVCLQAGSNTDLLASLKSGGGGTTVNVANVSQLNAAIAAASGGETIACATGSYADLLLTKNFATPITITSQNTGSPASFTATAGSSNAAITGSSAAGVMFKNVRIERHDHENVNSGASAGHCAYYTPIVELDTCANFTFDTVWFEGTTLGSDQNLCGCGRAVVIKGGSGHTITKSSFQHVYDSILVGYGAPTNNLSDRASNITITYNDFNEVSSDASKSAGVNGLVFSYNRTNQLRPGVSGPVGSPHCDLGQLFSDGGIDVAHGGQNLSSTNTNCTYAYNLMRSDNGMENGQGGTFYDSRGLAGNTTDLTYAHHGINFLNNILICPSYGAVTTDLCVDVRIENNEVYQIADKLVGVSGTWDPWIQVGYTTGTSTVKNNKTPRLFASGDVPYGTMPWDDPGNNITDHTGNIIDPAACTITSAQADTIVANWVATHRP